MLFFRASLAMRAGEGSFRGGGVGEREVERDESSESLLIFDRPALPAPQQAMISLASLRMWEQCEAVISRVNGTGLGTAAASCTAWRSTMPVSSFDHALCAKHSRTLTTANARPHQNLTQEREPSLQGALPARPARAAARVAALAFRAPGLGGLGGGLGPLLSDLPLLLAFRPACGAGSIRSGTRRNEVSNLSVK